MGRWGWKSIRESTVPEQLIWNDSQFCVWVHKSNCLWQHSEGICIYKPIENSEKPNIRLCASYSRNRTICIYDLEACEYVTRLSGLTPRHFSAVLFSLDNKILFVATTEPLIHFVDTKNAVLLMSVRNPSFLMAWHSLWQSTMAVFCSFLQLGEASAKSTWSL
jgi:hypothetical protein